MVSHPYIYGSSDPDLNTPLVHVQGRAPSPGDLYRVTAIIDGKDTHAYKVIQDVRPIRDPGDMYQLRLGNSAFTTRDPAHIAPRYLAGLCFPGQLVESGTKVRYREE